MIKPITRDVLFLRQKALQATRADLAVGRDLTDTLRANADRCVGMAANMIGVNKRVIVVAAGILSMVLYNPVITKKPIRDRGGLPVAQRHTQNDAL